MECVKLALITGGSSGLGLAMARILSIKGMTPIIIARDPERIESALAELQKHDGSAAGYSCDVTDSLQIKRIVDIIHERYGKIDFLITCAGDVHPGLAADLYSEGRLTRDIETNLVGTVRTTAAFLPLLSAGSKILLISSGFGLIGVAGYAPYCAAAAGIINFGQALRRELEGRKISVFVACPADIDTPQLRREKLAQPDWMGSNLVRRRPISPELASQKILQKCRGKRFLILINTDIKLLVLGARFLPRRFLCHLLDRIFPRPD